jgi:penicillin-binding protein 1C
MKSRSEIIHHLKARLFKHRLAFLIISVSLVAYFAIQTPQLTDPTSTTVYSTEGILLGAKIASDGQWRFPVMDHVPEKTGKAIVHFEDRYFWYHPGFNPVSIVRSLVQNIKAGQVVSGGSTLTMQLVRLARKGKARTFKEKLVELVLATKLEVKYTKEEILTAYLSHAPYGGNVVGIEAASWRYYGRGPDNLSWAEAATLAVLPNAPSLIFPGKNHELLLKKRNRLLLKLFENEVIDTMTYSLSLKERLPGKPKNLPQPAPHVTDRCFLGHRGQRVKTTLEASLQYRVNNIVSQHAYQLQFNEIHNMAVLVVDVESATIKAYVGNTAGSRDHGNDVDIVQAPRSTGSILKPLLYAAMLNDGELLPNTLVPDIPVFMDGFSPKNYHLGYDGAVPAHKALSLSLNVPAVYMLSRYGVPRFHHQLLEWGFATINRPPEHYGLSLILGGAEATLWDLCRTYTQMARVLKNTTRRDMFYAPGDYADLQFIGHEKTSEKPDSSLNPGLMNAASIWFALQALLEVNRPENESGWKHYSSSNKIAWKTGTSFGFRDAWAIGITPQYVVGVWVGNADGEGRPGLVGTLVAAPVLFDVFDILDPSGWFEKPYPEIIKVPVCRQSGFLPSLDCPETDTLEIPENGLRTKPCPYHTLVSIDKESGFRVDHGCVGTGRAEQKKWFVLPPAMEHYYKLKNPFYLPLPPMKAGCAKGNETVMEFIYPGEGSKIYVPVDMQGTKGKAVVEVAHRKPSSTLFWHLDNHYIGATETFHQMALDPLLGRHVITVVDQEGNSISRNIEIVGK